MQAAAWCETAGGRSAAHDLCICAPTGSGKTLAYALPIVAALSGCASSRSARLLFDREFSFLPESCHLPVGVDLLALPVTCSRTTNSAVLLTCATKRLQRQPAASQPAT